MKKYRLADIAEIVISSVDKKTKPGEKIVRLCNFTDVYHNWAIKQSDYDSFMVASASDSNINKLSLKKGFVAFTKDSETRDDIGISTYIADDFDDVVLGYHCALAKPNEKIVYGKYLNAFMSSDYIKKYFELNATGSGMRFTLAVSTMENMPIMLPSLNVQKKIGDMLSDFDKRTENLRAQNRVLEQTAKTIYDYTFLQCAGHQTTYNKTLNRNIPTNWEVKTVRDFAELITKGTTPTTIGFNFIETGVNFVKVECIENGKIITENLAHISEEAHEKLRRSNLQENDILVTIAGRLASPCVVPKSILPANTNQAVGIIRLKKENQKYVQYIFRCIFDPAMQNKLKGVNAQSIQKNLTLPNLGDIPIAVPDDQTLDEFNNQVTPLFQKQLVNTKQIEALTTQRNTLLPLLMTGQIEV